MGKGRNSERGGTGVGRRGGYSLFIVFFTRAPPVGRYLGLRSGSQHLAALWNHLRNSECCHQGPNPRDSDFLGLGWDSDCRIY